jgi:hypothetical protein
MIHGLDGHDGPKTETKGMLEIATNHYKYLSWKEGRPNIRQTNDFFSENEKIKPEENAILEDSFALEEIKEAVLSPMLKVPLA